MHEIGLLYETAKTVTAFAKENNINHICVVSLDVGELTGVLPQVFEDYYDYVAEQYPVMVGSKLDLHIIPGEAICDDCNAQYNVMQNSGKCPKCGSQYKTILGGQGIMLRQISY